MKFVKWFRQHNLFAPQKATTLKDVPIEVGDTVLCFNEDKTLYGVCGAVVAPAVEASSYKLLPTMGVRHIEKVPPPCLLS